MATKQVDRRRSAAAILLSLTTVGPADKASLRLPVREWRVASRSEPYLLLRQRCTCVCVVQEFIVGGLTSGSGASAERGDVVRRESSELDVRVLVGAYVAAKRDKQGAYRSVPPQCKGL